jgi:hypothetical protein
VQKAFAISFCQDISKKIQNSENEEHQVGPEDPAANISGLDLICYASPSVMHKNEYTYSLDHTPYHTQ